MKTRMPKSFIVLIVAIGVFASMFVVTNAASDTSLTSILSSTQQTTTTTTGFSENTTTYYTIVDIMYTMADRVSNNENYSSEAKNAAEDLEEYASLGELPEAQCLEIISEEATTLEDAEVLQLMELLKEKIKEMYAGEPAAPLSSATIVPESTTTTTASETTTEKPTTTSAPETTTEKPTTTSAPETTTEKQTTTSAPETTTEKQTTTSAPETTTEKQTTTSAHETTTEKQTTTSAHETTTKYYGEHSGVCGDNLTWSVNLDKRELVISGTGDMYNWSSSNSAPWYNYRSGISSITIGDGVTGIGDFAFYFFSSLTSVSIPDSVTSIGTWSFINCNSLSTITIPAGVKIIEKSAFHPAFTNITVDPANTAYSSDEFGVLFNKDKTELILYPNLNSRTSYKIPDGVTSIGYEAFYHSVNLTDVTIPDSVTSIGESAFRSCSHLTSVTIPDSVTSIGVEAFWSCDSLANITVDPANTAYSSDEFGVLFNKDKTVLIRYPVANSRTTYEIPNGVVTIDRYAFYGSSSLSSITIPDSLTVIEDGAFNNCASLSSVIIPDNVTQIGHNAFASCSSLSSVTIPDSVTTLGGSVFMNCTGLTKVVIGKGVTSIDACTFNGCSSLTNVTIPDNVTCIGYEAFSNCLSIENLIISDSVTSILTCAFSSCSSLTSVVIPDSVTSIGYGAFSYCTNLEYIHIPSSVTTIEEDILNSTSAYICSNSEDCYAKKYADENGLSFVLCEGHASSTGTYENLTYNIVDKKAIIVDCNETATGEILIPDEIDGYPVTSIGEFAFKNCDNITSVIIGNNVTDIKRQAFQSCDSLEKVIFPESLESIWSEAFNSCGSLTEITIPESVKSIGFGAFFNTYIETVYYQGTRSEWSNISLGTNSYEALNAVGLDDAAILFEGEDPLIITKGDFTFKVEEGEAEVIRCFPGEGTVEIPSEIFGYPVTSIGGESLLIENDAGYLFIPSSVTHISEYAFAWADSLATITVSEENPNYSSDEFGVLYNKDKTVLIKCPEGSEVVSYTVPDGVEVISAWSFKGCEYLQQIVFPDSITEIGSAAFYWCGSLKEAEFPEGISTIEDFTFAECYSLEKVTIPEGITHIGDAAFQSCGFTELSIPKSVVFIGASFFGDLSDPEDIITDIYYAGTEEEWNKISISEELNSKLGSVTIHFKTAPVLEEEFKVNTPTTSTVNYGDTLILHANISEIPEGCSIVWSVEGTGVTLSPSEDGKTCAVTCSDSGAVRVTATVVDADGNVVLDSEGNECVSGHNLTAKAGFFQKLISFFKNLFGMIRIIPQLFKASF